MKIVTTAAPAGADNTVVTVTPAVHPGGEDEMVLTLEDAPPPDGGGGGVVDSEHLVTAAVMNAVTGEHIEIFEQQLQTVLPPSPATAAKGTDKSSYVKWRNGPLSQ